MKKIALFWAVCGFAALSSQAQQTDWQLFPLGQRTLWQTGDEAFLYYCDSFSLFSPMGENRFLGAKYLAHGIDGPCYDTLLFHLYGLTKPPVDRFSIEADGIWRTGANGWLIGFFPLAKPGQSWSMFVGGQGFDELRFECLDQSFGDALGQPDSLKTFELRSFSNGQEVPTVLTARKFVLSKTYGFLKFSPLQRLLDAAPPERTIIGFEKNGQKHGFTNRFEDYFGNFKPGQIFKYETHRLNYRETIRDSVKSVAISPDGVSLSVFRKKRLIVTSFTGIPPDVVWHYDTTYFSATVAVEFSRIEYGWIDRSTPGWFELGLGSNFETSLIRKSAIGDWRYSFSAPALDVNEEMGHCVLNSLIDHCYGGKTVSSLFGLFKKDFLCLSGPDEFQLIGFKDGAFEFGDLSPIVAAREPLGAAALLGVWPNPTVDRLFFETPGAFSSAPTVEASVFDAAGRLLFSRKTASGQTELDVSALPQGLYFLIVENEKGERARAVFLKKD